MTNHGTEPLEKGMSLSNRKVFLPNIKLSQNIRKAVQKNVACEEELIKRLFDVDLKKRDALNEITLKKDAFLKEQWRLRRESMPDVYSRHILNQRLLFFSFRKARDELEFSKISPSCKLVTQRPEKLNITDAEREKKHLAESDSLQSNNKEKDFDGKNAEVHSWTPSPNKSCRKPILRRRSVADVDQAFSSDPLGQPVWLRRQTIHHIFQTAVTLQMIGTNLGGSNCDPLLIPASEGRSFGNPTISRYRKVLNRRISLQAEPFHHTSFSVEKSEES